MAKKASPKTDAMRAQREAAHGGAAEETDMSFEAQRRRLREKYESQMRAEESALAQRVLRDAERTLKEHIEASKDEVLKGLWKDVNDARRLSGGSTSGGNASSGSGGGTRVRRSADQLKAEAEKIYEIVKDSGSEGILSGDLKAKYEAQGVKVKGSLLDVLKEQGFSLKKEGERGTNVRYFAK